VSKDPSLEIRRPRPRSVEEFIGTDEGSNPPAAATPKLAAVPRPVERAPGAGHKNARGVAARAKGEAMGRLTVYVPLEVASTLRRYCFENGLELTGECSKAISEYVARLNG
jgi:hypothetical protein